MCLAATIPASAQSPTLDKSVFRQWKLAFVRDNSIWTANGDGSEQRLIIKNAFAPAWSPDKKRIAFARGSNVWVANADGTHQHKLTHFEGTENDEEIEISWRSRIDQITFSRTEWFTASHTADRWLDPPASERCFFGISIFDVNPSVKSKVAIRYDIRESAAGMFIAYNANPAWSHDGNTLFFVRSGDIWVADRVEAEPGGRAGWDVTRLAAVASYDAPTYRADSSTYIARHLSPSPDGKHLAYAFGRYYWDSRIYLLDLDKPQVDTTVTTGEKTLLSDPDGLASWPSFSPDSRYLAYRTPGPKPEVWAVSIASLARTRITTNGDQPAW